MPNFGSNKNPNNFVPPAGNNPNSYDPNGYQPQGGYGSGQNGYDPYAGGQSQSGQGYGDQYGQQSGYDYGSQQSNQSVNPTPPNYQDSYSNSGSQTQGYSDQYNQGYDYGGSSQSGYQPQGGYGSGQNGYDPYAGGQSQSGQGYGDQYGQQSGYDYGSQSSTGGGDYGSGAAGGYGSAGAQDIDYGSSGQFSNPAQTGDKNNNPQYNTFQEKKSGNKKFLFFAVGAVLLLLIVAAVLTYINFGSGNGDSINDTINNLTNNGNDTSLQQGQESTKEIIDAEMTGGEQTPATKAIVNTDKILPADWVVKKFSISYRDNEGNCTKENVCGPDSDPDKDGLVNIYEYNLDTDPMDADTDKDKLADGDEAFVFYTNPKSTISGTGTTRDADSIIVCLDPLTGEKFTDDRLDEISSKVTLNPLNPKTIETFKKAGASEEDITTGYPSDKCSEDSNQDSNTQDSEPASSSDSDESSGEDLNSQRSDPVLNNN